MKVEIYGARRAYGVENLPEILRETANEMERGGDSPKYCCEDVERAMEILGNKLGFSRADIQLDNIHLKKN